MRIVHIADVHWRGLTRHKEYKTSFKDMFSQCRNLDVDAFVVAGDIVHSKTQGISPELIDCLNWWFTEMSRIAPVHVMLGNHDGLIMNTDRQDAISPILRALNLQRVYLYKKSGTYQDPDFSKFNWCIYSPFDEANYKEVVPEPGKINIAVYHGAVWGSHTDSDFMLDGDTKMDLFKPFDFTMLGDIHKRQQIDKDGRIHYCGSTIQQNYGESGEKGFLLWDIRGVDDWDIKFFPVAHANPFVTVDWKGTVQKTARHCMKNWPPGARYRIKSNITLDPKSQRKLATVLRREHDADEVVYKLDLKSESSFSAEVTEKIKIADLGNPDTHKNLLREYTGEETKDDTEFWVAVDRIIDDVVPKLKISDDHKGNKWSVRNINFDNTFGYGKDNSIDFTKLTGIVGLFGRNRSGKSSIPGTLMYGLYNSNDRGITSVMHVINSRFQDCSADITFSVNGKLYRLERHSVRYAARGVRNAGAMSYLSLYEIDDDGKIIKDLSGEQRRETEKELRALIGQPEDFMMTSFASQGGMNNFIAQGSTERKKTLSNFMGLDIFDQMQFILKEDSAGVKGMLKRLQAKDWVTEIRVEKQRIVEFEKRKDDLESDISQLREKYSSLKDEANNTSDGYFIDPAMVTSKKRILQTKQTQLTEVDSNLEVLSEEQTAISNRLNNFCRIRDSFPLESYKRRLELLSNLKNTLHKMNSKFDKEKTLMNSQKKSVKLLKEVPCGEQFLTCKFIKQSHENKILLESQKTLVSELKSGLSTIKDQVSELEEEGLQQKLERYRELTKNISDLEMKKVINKSNLEKNANLKSNLITVISSLENEISELELKATSDQSASIEKLKSILKRLDSEIEEKKSDLFENLRQIGQSTAKIGNLQKESIEYDRLQVEWKVYDFLLKATSWRGIPTFIMSRQLPIINAELSKILQDVAGFTVDLRVDERNTDVYINYGDSMRPIECGSGMEKMVSSMALRVALGNVSNLNKSDMFIVDEGFGSLDPQNIEAVTSLLKKLKKYYRLILIISHIDIVKDSVDDVIEITKSGKNSKVVYG